MGRMFSSSLQEEVKALGEDIEMVKDKVDDPVICEKLRQFVYALSCADKTRRTSDILEMGFFLGWLTSIAALGA